MALFRKQTLGHIGVDKLLLENICNFYVKKISYSGGPMTTPLSSQIARTKEPKQRRRSVAGLLQSLAPIQAAGCWSSFSNWAGLWWLLILLSPGQLQLSAGWKKKVCRCHGECGLARAKDSIGAVSHHYWSSLRSNAFLFLSAGTHLLKSLWKWPSRR